MPTDALWQLVLLLVLIWSHVWTHASTTHTTILSWIVEQQVIMNKNTIIK